MMTFRPLFLLAVVSFTVLTISAPVLLAENPVQPGDFLTEKIDQVMSLVNDTDLNQPDSHTRLRNELVSVLEPLFPFEEITIRVLGPHARGLSSDQIHALSREFRKLLEQVYVDRFMENISQKDKKEYGIDSIKIVKQRVRGNYAKVKSIAKVRRKGVPVDITMVYSMINRDGRWYIYDLSLDGISLVDNYRAQFHEVLTNHDFHYLLEMLKNKVTGIEKDRDSSSRSKG